MAKILTKFTSSAITKSYSTKENNMSDPKLFKQRELEAKIDKLRKKLERRQSFLSKALGSPAESYWGDMVLEVQIELNDAVEELNSNSQ